MSARATLLTVATLASAPGAAAAFFGGLLRSRRVVDYASVTIPAPAAGPPTQEITVVDLTEAIRKRLEATGLRDGSVNIISRHTTTAVTINEWESRLVRDMRAWLLKLAPPDERSAIGADGSGIAYLHNDIGLRPDSEDERRRCVENGWDIDDPVQLQRWRDQEPINAHSHLAAMLLGSSECGQPPVPSCSLPPPHCHGSHLAAMHCWRSFQHMRTHGAVSGRLPPSTFASGIKPWCEALV